jgi:photosystem II stability/assembly factor-like uncharacterized protein
MTCAPLGAAESDHRDGLQALLDHVQASAKTATTRQAWLWGEWHDPDELATCLNATTPAAGPPAWHVWATGPKGALVVADDQAALWFFRRVFAQRMPRGRFAAVVFEPLARQASPNGPSVFLAASDIGPSWERAPLALDPDKRYNHPGYALLAAHQTAGFVVGPTAHARLLDQAQRPMQR